MNMVRVTFPDPDEEARGVMALAREVTVIGLRDNRFEIPRKSLAILDRIGVRYEVTGEEGFDGACQALRSALANQV